jgi:hypothetical protein
MYGGGLSCYKIIWHKIFEYQYKNLVEDSLLKRQIDKQLEVIASDPANAGDPLKALPPDLSGKVKKLWVGGRKGHRMFIKTDHHEKVVKICFVTPVKRGHLDYKKLTQDLVNLLDDQVEERTLKKFIIK